eukprot:scaffold7587_cov71-Skeletonema_dohrnii-CCMP3373.AAC.1
MDADDQERVDGVVAASTAAAASIESNDCDSPMKLASSNEEEDVNMMSISANESSTSSPQVVQSPSTNSQQQQQQQSSNNARSVSLHLTPEEERLFTLLINAAEAYERGELVIDPNPTEKSLSARGGFTKAATAATTTDDSTSTDKDDTNKAKGASSAPSWLKPPPRVNHIEIRIAGGWVRDKLLRQHSVDVDVALDCMMGVQFARIVQSYLAMEQEGENSGKSGGGGGKEEGLMSVDDAEDANQQQQQQQVDNETKPPSQRGHEKPKKKKKKTNKQPKIGVIGANPSQSKHLETATMNIH